MQDDGKMPGRLRAKPSGGISSVVPFVSAYRKCTALEFAEKQCAEYPDDPGFKTARNMIRAEAQRQMQEP